MSTHRIEPTLETLDAFLSDGEIAVRVIAAYVSESILRRKSGKYAERPADVFDVIHLAEWILSGGDAE